MFSGLAHDVAAFKVVHVAWKGACVESAVCLECIDCDWNCVIVNRAKDLISFSVNRNKEVKYYVNKLSTNGIHGQYAKNVLGMFWIRNITLTFFPCSRIVFCIMLP